MATHGPKWQRARRSPAQIVGLPRLVGPISVRYLAAGSLALSNSALKMARKKVSSKSINQKIAENGAMKMARIAEKRNRERQLSNAQSHLQAAAANKS
ncbi:hypothetical protein [Pseudarthrobacter sp. DSP2-3-2b1]|uniref:hypothetical protein n=1 Tax=Pseudarthrobacter sp. DSP2-3-2b1 TaxID=2804661 RepID=UPI003CF40937